VAAGAAGFFGCSYPHAMHTHTPHTTQISHHAVNQTKTNNASRRCPRLRPPQDPSCHPATKPRRPEGWDARGERGRARAAWGPPNSGPASPGPTPRLMLHALSDALVSAHDCHICCLVPTMVCCSFPPPRRPAPASPVCIHPQPEQRRGDVSKASRVTFVCLVKLAQAGAVRHPPPTLLLPAPAAWACHRPATHASSLSPRHPAGTACPICPSCSAPSDTAHIPPAQMPCPCLRPHHVENVQLPKKTWD